MAESQVAGNWLRLPIFPSLCAIMMAMAQAYLHDNAGAIPGYSS